MGRQYIKIALIGVAAGTLASCSQDPILPSSAVKEEYTKNFIRDFGIPAPGHDFAMAKSAGLKVKTAKGTHIIVTAEVDGKEYLFANVSLSAGTHDLPVTIPQSVTTVKIKSGFKTIEAGVNDIVDIDEDIPSSRGVEISSPTGDNTPFTFTDNDEEAPVIVFSPDQFLNAYLDAHPKGVDSTNKWYLGNDIDKGYIDPWVSDDIYVYHGETGLGATDINYNEELGWHHVGLHYLIFPVWWNTNKYGSKDYRLSMVQYSKANNDHDMPFNDKENAKIPFPQLGYSTNEIDPTIVMDNLNSFTYDDGSFDKAFDPAVAKTVVSMGVKVDMNPDKWEQSGLRFDLRSGNGSTYSYSSTVPYWNSKVWDENYYDVSLTDLMFSTVSTMLYPLDGQNFEVLNYRANNNIGQTDPRFCDSPMLIGFTSQPKCEADTDPRDYTDLILLVLPTHGLQLLYNIYDVPEPFIWTMAVEDLGGTDDWDFNDVVFHFTDVIKDLNTVNGNNIVTYWSGTQAAWPTRVIEVWPEATGGTMPIYITFSNVVFPIPPLPEWGDEKFSEANNKILECLYRGQPGTFVVGKEIHSWLGASSYTQFVNVGSKRTGKTGEHVQFAIDPSAKLDYTEGGVFGSKDNYTLYGFALLVDKGNDLQIDAINSEEKGLRQLSSDKLNKDTYIMIGAPNENGSVAPQMLLISDGDGTWQWPTERTKISNAYPDFNKWVTNPASTGWTNNPDESQVTKK